MLDHQPDTEPAPEVDLGVSARGSRGSDTNPAQAGQLDLDLTYQRGSRDSYADACKAARGVTRAALTDPKLTFGELRVLVAVLEEVTLWSKRHDTISRARIAELAGVSERTVTTVLRRFDRDGILTYIAGAGRGHRSRVFMAADPVKGEAQDFPVSEPRKGEAQGRKRRSPGLPAPEERENLLPPTPHVDEPTTSTTDQPEEEDEITRQAADALLEALPVTVRRHARPTRRRWQPALAACLAAGWALDRLIAHVTAESWDGARSPVAVLRHRLDELRHTDPSIDAPPERPPWCGHCDERTRQVELDDSTMRRCASCNPHTAAAPLAAAVGAW
jgi:hypothetical protein